jgi:hypothetical protein
VGNIIVFFSLVSSPSSVQDIGQPLCESSLCHYPAGAETSKRCPSRQKDLIEHPIKTQVPLDLCWQQGQQQQTFLEVSWGDGTVGKTDNNWGSLYGTGPNYSLKMYYSVITWAFFLNPTSRSRKT